MRSVLTNGHASRLFPRRKTQPMISATKRTISSTRLTIDRLPPNEQSIKRMPPKKDLKFGKIFSPHMLQVRYSQAAGGWGVPEIVPFQDLTLSPAAAALHYGLECFEGMKAYKTIEDGSDLRLFRPELNMQRLKDSMGRLSMPGNDFNSGELIKCIGELVRVDQDWIPQGEGYSMYLRPAVIATHPFLGLNPPDDLLLYVITSPVGPYYASGFEPIRLTTDTPYVRAWPGGSGSSKVGGNYGPAMKPGAEANERGYSQILWLFGKEEEVTEVGAMNVFFSLEMKDGRRELVTPPLTRGDILPGVTRRSVLELAEGWGEFDVVERSIAMPEIRDAAAEGRLIEAFGAGTAAVVTPISHIEYRGQDIEIPVTGALTKRVFDELVAIQYGKVKGPEGWSLKI